MKTFFTIALLAFLLPQCNFCIAQDAGKIATLQNQLQYASSDTQRCNLLSQLSFNYSVEHTDSAVIYAKTLMQLAIKINYAKGIGDAYNDLGWADFLNGNNVAAKNYLDTAYQIFKKINVQRYLSRPLSNLATIASDEGNYAQALKYLSEALQYEEAANEPGESAQILFNIGRTYNHAGDHQKARAYFMQARDIQKQLGNDLLEAAAISTIANTYQFEEKYDSALLMYKQILPIYLRHNDTYRTGNLYENISIAYENKNDLEAALLNMQKATAYYSKINSNTDLANAKETTGEIYFKMNDEKNAMNSYKGALALSKKIPLLDLTGEIFNDISKVYIKQGDYKNAFLYRDSADNISDSIFSKDKQDEFLKLQTQFETERKEKENQLLKAQNFAASVQLKQSRTFLIASIAGIVLLAFLLYMLYKNRQTKIEYITQLEKLNAVLSTQKKELNLQKEEIIRMNTLFELKALRAQMNPHFIFNCMSSIQECMMTDRIDDANTYLSKLSRLLRMVLYYSDEENIPLDKELDMLRLYLLLENIRLEGTINYNIIIDEEINEDELLIPTLILQPFVENAIWHGLMKKDGARNLNIHGSIENDMLYFVIEDNGIGRNKAPQQKHSNIYQSKAMSLITQRLDVLKHQANVSQTGFVIHDLHNADEKATGTRVEIFLPLLIAGN